MYSYPNCQRSIKWIISSIGTRNKPLSTEDCGFHHFFSRVRMFRGGGERARTDGLLRARQALSQLSYTPILDTGTWELEFIHPVSNLDCLVFRWWAWMELNHRPHAYQACALTELSYRPRLDTRDLILETKILSSHWKDLLIHIVSSVMLTLLEFIF